jgi:dTMP kinase
MGFIVIEGLDGAGKSTQIKYIEDYFFQQGMKTKFIHFPRTDSPIWGELISRFLRGELGAIDTVNPYLVSLIYAGDRNDASETLKSWMNKGFVVIADRYLYSNIAFQCAKLKDTKERSRLARWIKELEYIYYKIPMPDLNLFLNVPFQFTMKSLGNRREGIDREYLNGADDIHEADLDFQQKVREMYLWQVDENADFKMINCSDDQGNMLKPDKIAAILIDMIKKNLK